MLVVVTDGVTLALARRPRLRRGPHRARRLRRPTGRAGPLAPPRPQVRHSMPTGPAARSAPSCRSRAQGTRTGTAARRPALPALRTPGPPDMPQRDLPARRHSRRGTPIRRAGPPRRPGCGRATIASPKGGRRGLPPSRLAVRGAPAALAACTTPAAPPAAAARRPRHHRVGRHRAHPRRGVAHLPRRRRPLRRRARGARPGVPGRRLAGHARRARLREPAHRPRPGRRGHRGRLALRPRRRHRRHPVAHPRRRSRPGGGAALRQHLRRPSASPAPRPTTPPPARCSPWRRPRA